MFRRATALLVVLAACSCAATATSGARERADRHAKIAGTVMSRWRYPTPAPYLAASVTGRDDDDTIDALVADGTSYRGRVILRITVFGDGTLADPNDVAACYEYRFRHRREDATPRALACPASEPLTLPDPSTLPLVTAGTRARVRAALVALSATQRADAEPARTAVAAALGPDYAVAADRAGGAVHLRVSAQDTCLDAVVHTNDVAVGAAKRGDACTGG